MYNVQCTAKSERSEFIMDKKKTFLAVEIWHEKKYSSCQSESVSFEIFSSVSHVTRLRSSDSDRNPSFFESINSNTGFGVIVLAVSNAVSNE